MIFSIQKPFKGFFVFTTDAERHRDQDYYPLPFLTPPIKIKIKLERKINNKITTTLKCGNLLS